MTEEMAVLDDLEMDLNPEDYPDQKPASPPPAGNYRYLLRKASWRTDQQGNRKLTDGKYPVLVLEQVEIIEPFEDAKKLYPFQDVYTKPFMRDGKPANSFFDILRSFDRTVSIQKGDRSYEEFFDEAMEILQGFIQAEIPFTAALDWTAFDKATADAAITALGVPKEQLTKKQKDDIYGRAKVQSMRKFPKLADGTYSPFWTAPSGVVQEAKVKLTRFWPQGMALKIGKAA